MAEKTQAQQFKRYGVGAAYGDPIEQDGCHIVPVAFASFGFGSFDDTSVDAKADDFDDEGASGTTARGNAGVSIPLGAYITRDGYTRFEPNVVTLLAVGVPFVWFVGRALARVIRALKR